MRKLRAGVVAGIVSLATALSAVVPAGRAGATEQSIVFVRDGNLWSMDGRGGSQQQLTTKGSGHVSVSLTGTIVMDRFLPYGPPKPLSDLNLYQFSVDGSSKAKLTNDNLSRGPAVSPDGSRIAYQKFAWKGERNYLGEGRGIWLIDTATGEQRELVGIAPPPPELRQARAGGNPVLASEESTWTDYGPRWSMDNRALIFTRAYKAYGSWTYWVDLSNPEAPEIVVYPGYSCGRDVNGSRMLCFENESMSLLVHDFRSGRSIVLAKDVFVGDAKYSPDGQRVAFVVKSGVHLTQSDLWTVDSSGRNLKKISSTPLHDIDEVWWTADGQRLVFERYYSAENRSEVWSVASDGSDLRRLVENAKDPRPTRRDGPAPGEIVLPVRTLWGQDDLLYVNTADEAAPCTQEPCIKDADGNGCDDLEGVLVGCSAVAVGQLINYWFENGQANGWLDTMLQNRKVYPRPWSKGGIGQAACTHQGFPTEDSYSNRTKDEVYRFLWNIGLGLDVNYRESGSSLRVYFSEQLFDLTRQNADKLASLLEDRFRFRVIAGPSAVVGRLDDLAQDITRAIDAGRPVLLRLVADADLGHVALVQGYRRSSSAGIYTYDYLINFGGGPTFPARWVPGAGAFDAGGHRWVRFQTLDVAPVTAPVPRPVVAVPPIEDGSSAACRSRVLEVAAGKQECGIGLTAAGDLTVGGVVVAGSREAMTGYIDSSAGSRPVPATHLRVSVASADGRYRLVSPKSDDLELGVELVLNVPERTFAKVTMGRYGSSVLRWSADNLAVVVANVDGFSGVWALDAPAGRASPVLHSHMGFIQNEKVEWIDARSFKVPNIACEQFDFDHTRCWDAAVRRGFPVWSVRVEGDGRVTERLVSAPPGAPQQTVRVGDVQGLSNVGGCGCVFSPISAEGRMTFSRFTFSSDYGCGATMNLDGKDVALRAARPVSAGAVAEGGECPRLAPTYLGGGYSVRLSTVETRRCPPEPTECEVTQYDAAIAVEQGERRAVVLAKGQCGC